MPTRGPEGEISVAVVVERDHVRAVRIRSQRPDVACTLLQGMSRADIRSFVPTVFAICSRSQTAAAELACAAAAGDTLSTERLGHHRDAVAAERVRETALWMLLKGPHDLGEAPSDDTVAAIRRSMSYDGTAAAGEQIAIACFGEPAAQWLSVTRDPASLQLWLDKGSTATARTLRRVRDATRGSKASPIALVPSPPSASDVARLGELLSLDAHFVRAPTWRGEPAETGALARRRSDAVVLALARDSRPLARCMARLRELAEWLMEGATVALGAQRGADGSGLGWVESARGLLVHQVALHDDRAECYRILAPTEWNFHPQGALALELIGTRFGDRHALHQRATWLADSLDPCVSCRIEVQGA